MDSSCYICQHKRENHYFFSCGHSFCIQCLYRHIFINHIHEFSNSDTIRAVCKCKEKGTLSVSMAFIQEVLRKKIEIDQSESGKETCHLHEKEELTKYCKHCQRPICEVCAESSEHFQHEIIGIDEYLKKIRKFLNDLPLKYKTLEDFLERFDSVAKQFRDDMEKDFNTTIRGIDSLIKNLQNLKAEYAKIIKENLEKGIQLLKIIKMFYCNFFIEFNKKEYVTDVYVLKYLKDINYEFDELKLIHNKDVEEKLNALTKQSDELVHTKTNLLDLYLSFKDIPRNYNKIYSLYEHTKAINCVVQLRDGSLATGSADYTIRFWEEKGGEYKNNLVINELTGNVIFLYQLRDERLVSTAKDNNTIKVWDLSAPVIGPNGKSKIPCELTLSGHRDSVTCLLQLPDEKLITASRDQTIGVWEPIGRSFQQKAKLVEHQDGVFCICELPWGRIASGSDDNTIRIWQDSEDTYKCVSILGGHTKGVRALCILKDGRLASAGEDCTIKIWSIEEDNYTNLQSLLAHHRGITSLIQLADERLVTTSKDGSVRIFIDTQKGFIANEKLKVHTNQVFCVVQLTDGRLASSGADNQVIIWKCGKMYD